MTIITTLSIYNAHVISKERKRMLSLHIVYVTLHMQFNISIEQDKWNW